MTAASDAGRVGVWGRSGSGKSTYVKAMFGARARLVVFDPLDEYRELPGFVRATSIRGVRDAMAKRWGAGFRIAYIPAAGAEAARLSELSWLLCKAQARFKAGQDSREITLVVEEMNTCFPVHGLSPDIMGFGEICSRGRHYGIEVAGVSQRIAEVNTRFRGNCTETIVFPQQGPRDVRAARDALGFVSEQEIMALADHHYIRVARGQKSTGKNRLKK